MPIHDAPTKSLRDPSADSAEVVDLIELLKRVLPRQAGDLLKITHIPGTRSFRANWYDSRLASTLAIPGLSIAYIRESIFLDCRMGDDGTPTITYRPRQ